MNTEESYLSKRVWIAFIVLEAIWLTLGLLVSFSDYTSKKIA